MNSRNIAVFVYVLLVMLSGCVHSDTVADKQPEPSQSIKSKAEILQSWHGDYPVAQIDLLPKKQRKQALGFIGDKETFERVWKVFQPNAFIPIIDFKVSLVLFAHNTQFYNRISIAKVDLRSGVAEVLVMETRSAMPIKDKVAISLAVVPRKDIRAIHTVDGLIFISE